MNSFLFRLFQIFNTNIQADDTLPNNAILSFTTIEQGYNSGVSIVVADSFKKEQCFHKFWRRHTSKQFPPPDPPINDFGTKMIIAVFRGTQSSTGYTINITSIEESDSEIIVRGEMTDPPSWSLVGQALTQPHHIVSVKKSNKPIKYEIEKVHQPRPFPTFTLAFEEGVDVAAQVEQIENMEAVQSVNHLQSLDLVIVNFDPDLITANDANEMLLGLDGIDFVEADPPLVDEENNHEENDDNIFLEDHSWRPFFSFRGSK